MPSVNRQVFAAKTDAGVSGNLDTQGNSFATLTLVITAIGATPTVTIDLEGGADGTNFTQLGTTTETTVATFRVSVNEAHRFIRANVTANTNVTMDVWLTVTGSEIGNWLP